MTNFEPVFINGITLDDTWHQLLWNLKEKGRKYQISTGSNEGQYRLAFDFVSGVVKRPHDRPLAPRMPEAGALSPPTTDEEIEHYFAKYLMDPRLALNEHYKYASWIAGGNGLCEVTQLSWIINHLKVSPGNGHCYIGVGTPEWLLHYDEPYKNCKRCNKWFNWSHKACPYCDGELTIHEDRRRTTPCLRGLDFRIIDGALFTMVYYRSWDIMAWPTNMGGFTLLNEYVAQEIGVEPGPLAFSSKSLHIYEESFRYLDARLNR